MERHLSRTNGHFSCQLRRTSTIIFNFSLSPRLSFFLCIPYSFVRSGLTRVKLVFKIFTACDFKYRKLIYSAISTLKTAGSVKMYNNIVPYNSPCITWNFDNLLLKSFSTCSRQTNQTPFCLFYLLNIVEKFYLKNIKSIFDFSNLTERRILLVFTSFVQTNLFKSSLVQNIPLHDINSAILQSTLSKS